MVVNALQLGLLYSPELHYVRIGQTTKELEPESKQLPLIRIVEPTTAFAGVSLARMIHRQGLVLDGRYGAHLTFAFIEDLEELVKTSLHESKKVLPWLQWSWCNPSTSATRWPVWHKMTFQYFPRLEERHKQPREAHFEKLVNRRSSLGVQNTRCPVQEHDCSSPKSV
jgi:hypothetical protein